VTDDHEALPSNSRGQTNRSAFAATVLLFRIGSGHTLQRRSFVERPEFAVWMWLYAIEVGAAAAFGLVTTLLPVR
jgi:hypothetical protein